MRITEEQERALGELECVRLSSDDSHLRTVDSFENYKNSNVVDALKCDGFAEDEARSITYYLIRDKDKHIFFFFALKCGSLYDEFIEGEQLQGLRTTYAKIVALLQSEKTTPEEKEIWSLLLEKTRAKKKLKKEEIARLKSKPLDGDSMNLLLGSEEKNVGRTFSGIELVYFCANDEMRELWKQKFAFNQKIGAVVFWTFVVPKVLEARELVGCEYLYLFAADNTADKTLVNYYRSNLFFSDETEHKTAIPLYDFACTFMYLRTKDLEESQKRFFNDFNREDAV